MDALQKKENLVNDTLANMLTIQDDDDSTNAGDKSMVINKVKNSMSSSPCTPSLLGYSDDRHDYHHFHLRHAATQALLQAEEQQQPQQRLQDHMEEAYQFLVMLWGRCFHGCLSIGPPP